MALRTLGLDGEASVCRGGPRDSMERGMFISAMLVLIIAP